MGRDVNGAPKSDYPWGIPLLVLVWIEIISIGIDLGEILFLLGMAGSGLEGINLNPITHGKLYPVL